MVHPFPNKTGSPLLCSGKSLNRTPENRSLDTTFARAGRLVKARLSLDARALYVGSHPINNNTPLHTEVLWNCSVHEMRSASFFRSRLWAAEDERLLVRHEGSACAGEQPVVGDAGACGDATGVAQVPFPTDIEVVGGGECGYARGGSGAAGERFQPWRGR